MDAGQFVGRDVELEVFAAALDAAAAGRSTLVWVEGPGGSGKSALVSHVLDAAPPELPVRRVGAEEVAGDLAFALVDQFDFAHDGHPFSTGLALLELFTAGSSTSASLIVIEDLHWADAASRQALLTAARRFDLDGVVMVVTTRPEPDGDDDDGWTRFLREQPHVARIDLGPLSVDDIGELFDRRGVRVSPDRAAEIHAHTLGHPLHVRTLLDGLTGHDLGDTGGPLPVPPTVAAATMARISALPADAQSLAAALAVLNRTMPMATVAAVGEVSQSTEALDVLLHTGIISWQPTAPGTPLSYAHPLLRLAVYESLSPVTRQRMHRLAAGLTDETSALAHRVASADGFDDGLADDLVAAATKQRSNDRRATAAAYLLSASMFRSDRSVAEGHLLRAAQLFLDDGQTRRVSDLEDQIVACVYCGRRSLVLGVLAWQRVDAVDAERWLGEAGADADPDVAGPALALLGTIYAFQMRAAETLAAGEAVIALDVTDPDVEREGWWAITIGEALLNGPRAGLDRLAQRIPPDPGLVVAADADLLTLRAMIAGYASEIASPLADLRATMTSAGRRPGTRAHLHLAQTLYRAGAWDEAVTQARVARSLAADRRELWVLAQIEATLAEILAARGDDAAAVHFAAAREVSMMVPTFEAVTTTTFAAAAMAFVRFEPSEVLAQLQPLSDNEADLSTTALLSIGWWPTLVIAHIDVGDLRAARREHDRFHTAAERRHLDFTAPLADVDARIAWAANEPDALDAFDRAIGLTSEMPALERALLHQAYAEALHASGNRRPAMEQLRIAHALLDELGAEPFRERVDAGMRKRGERPVRSRAERRFTLTERERDVASLVATGMTNKEVAANLYVSSKAVEYHLGNIFGKLGLSSRRELRQRSTELLASG